MNGKIIVFCIVVLFSIVTLQNAMSMDKIENNPLVDTNSITTIQASSLSTDNGFDCVCNQWTQINPDGFNHSTNLIPRGITVFNDVLVVGIGSYTNMTPIAVEKPMRFTDFLFEAFLNETMLGNFRSDGCEVWAYDGTEWKILVGRNTELKQGFGDNNNSEVGVLINFKGYLYAGLRNLRDGFQIWRTIDLEDWEMVANGGLGNPNNDAVWSAAIYHDSLYIGTLNFDDGCEIFKTKTGNIGEWTPILNRDTTPSTGFGTSDNFYVWSMSVYQDELYIGTNNRHGGGELWKTNDEDTWIPLLAFQTTAEAEANGALYPRGFTSGDFNYRGGIRSMSVYDDELYLGFTGEDLLICYQFKGHQPFLKIHQEFPKILLHPIKFHQAQGLEIWSYNGHTNQFTQKVGGISTGNNAGGFGDPRNDYPWSMITHEDTVFVGTARPDPFIFEFSWDSFQLMITLKMPTGGGELWKCDENGWMQINTDGFGDEFNAGIREMIVYNDALIACTANVNTGCEIWKLDDI